MDKKIFKLEMYFALFIQIEAMGSKYQEASYFNIFKLLT